MPLWLFLVLCLWVAPSHAAVVDRVAAVVDGYVITSGEVDDFLAFQERMLGGPPMDRDQAVEALIERALVEREAKRRGLLPGDQELQQALADIRTRNRMDEAQFRQAVEGQGLAFDTYTDQVRAQMTRVKVAGAVLRDLVEVDDEALREYYLKHVAEFCESPSLRLVHVEVAGEAARERAEAVRQQVARAGDPAAAADQGRVADMGFVPVDNLAAEVRAALEGVEPGQVSPVLEKGGACNLFYVAERREGRVRSFEEVRDKLRERYLMDQEQELFRRWLDDRKAEAVIRRKPEG